MVLSFRFFPQNTPIRLLFADTSDYKNIKYCALNSYIVFANFITTKIFMQLNKREPNLTYITCRYFQRGSTKQHVPFGKVVLNQILYHST